MDLSKSWLPDLNRPGMRAEDKLRIINEYLIDFEKKVRHALSNIDEENLSEALADALKSTGNRLKELEENKGGGKGGDGGSNVTWLDVLLNTADWINLTQTVEVQGVTADRTGCAVVVSPDPDSYEEYVGSGVICAAQGAGTLTFKAETAPTVNITVCVMVAK